jgi:hypothetical protein
MSRTFELAKTPRTLAIDAATGIPSFDGASIIMNADEAVTPSETVAFEVERGTSNNVSIRWNETSDVWELTTDGVSFSTIESTGNIALGTDTTGNYVQQGATSGNGISGSVNSEGGTFTVTSNATDANTASTIVFRDASGNFSAGTISAALSGNASTASALSSAVTVELTGDVTGSATFTNAGDTASIATTVAANSVALGTDTTGNYVATISGTTNEVEVSGSGSETAAVTIGLPNDVTIGNNLTVTGALNGPASFTII